MKKKELVVIIAAVFIAFSILTSLFYFSIRERIELIGAEKVQTVDMDLMVGDRVGLNADRDMLNFGIVMPGSGATRSINITNTHPYAISAKLFKEGNISPFISFQKESVVGPGESELVPISANVPLNNPSESYSGRLTVAFFPVS